MLFIHDHGFHPAYEYVALLLIFIIVYFLIDTMIPSFNKKMSFLDSVYFAVCTQSTVGFGDIHPVKWYTKILVIVHILLFMWIIVLRPKLFHKTKY